MSIVQLSTLTGAFPEPINRGVPVESTKFARGISWINFTTAGSVADARCESLRTRLLRLRPWRCRRPSYERKKKVLFLTSGPPRLPPARLRLKGGGLLEVNSKKLRASSASFRRNSNSSPWNSLVPERVAMLTTAPELCPYSALNVELSTLNSLTLLIEGWKLIELNHWLLSVMPLTRKLTLSSRLPAVLMAKEPLPRMGAVEAPFCGGVTEPGASSPRSMK